MEQIWTIDSIHHKHYFSSKFQLFPKFPTRPHIYYMTDFVSLTVNGALSHVTVKQD